MDLKDFSDALTDIQPQIMKYIMKKQSNALGEGKITIPQYVALHLMDSLPNLKMRDIARELNITFPSATALVNRLYKMQLVKRKADSRDRRIVHIELTHKGDSMMRDLRAQRLRAIKDIFGDLSEKERNDYLRIVTKIKNTLYLKAKR